MRKIRENRWTVYVTLRISNGVFSNIKGSFPTKRMCKFFVYAVSENFEVIESTILRSF